ncbi:MAG: type II toxin-antitoxin system RelE/ParE family toxin [Terracidiphilus sp.]
MAWAIEYAETAKKQLRKLDKLTARRVLDFMDERVALSEDPRALGKALKGSLGDLWSYRVGDYRVLCDIQDLVLTVLVLQIGNRREIYR